MSVGMVAEREIVILNVGEQDAFFKLDSLANAGESFGDMTLGVEVGGQCC